MKYVKMLAVATTALAAISTAVATGTASAEKLCTEQKIECPAGKHEPTGTVTLRSLVGTFRLWTGTFTIDTCTGQTIKAKTTNTAATGERIKFTNESYTHTGCTEPTTTLSPGKEEIAHIEGTNNGTLISSELEITVNTTVFGSCVFGTGAGTDMGTVVGGNPATVKINATVTRISGLCPSTATWEADYMITEPKPIWIAKK